VGAFTGGCGYLASDAFSGDAFGALLRVRVPSDGVLVIATSSCCDASFSQPGSESGTYTLSVDALTPIGSIGGRLLDDVTGEPVVYGGNRPVRVDLFRCPSGQTSNCPSVASLTVGQDGRFQIAGQDPPLFLDAADYYLTISAAGYPPLTTPTFAVAAGEDKDLGDVALHKPQPAGQIDGRVVDSQTGAPLGGAQLSLQRCADFQCAPIGLIASGADGAFSFSEAAIGVPITEGSYSLTIAAPAYDTSRVSPIDLAAGQGASLGDLALAPTQQIGSVSGRLVDAVTRQPLSGPSSGFGTLSLLRCDTFGCFETVNLATINADGSFRFAPPRAGLNGVWRPGSFAVSYFVDQHIPAQTPAFKVAKDQDLDLGDIAVQPLPITLASGPACGAIPANGGACRYSLSVTNNQARTADLRVWSVVFTYSPSSEASAFQPEGAKKIRLRPGQSRTVNFSLDVPKGVEAATPICTSFYVADDTKAFYFAPSNQAFGFCVMKDAGGAFRQVQGDELRQLQQRMNNAPEAQRTRR
jgi:5-hydroxyisourate hydrolase-like protein (transthyretin family)